MPFVSKFCTESCSFIRRVFLDKMNLVSRPGQKAKKQNTMAENIVNTLGQIETLNINQMITLSELVFN
jgi:hypothetical protein